MARFNHMQVLGFASSTAGCIPRADDEETNSNVSSYSERCFDGLIAV